MGTAPLTLVIGNKVYSSWSLRPWLLLKHGGVAFEEVRIPLYAPDSKARIRAWSPAGHVPVLADGALRIWDSLAICETLAERFPERCGWPKDAEARAVARSVSAEMHAGFFSLRHELPFYAPGPRSGVLPSDAARGEIARVQQIWEDCRARFGRGGPWLFGAFSPADAMYAPVALRLLTYGIELPPVPAAYAESVRRHPAVEEWCAAAREETEVLEKFERGTPVG
jgi:glutathione S-transferase